jgi:hypothetical protein
MLLRSSELRNGLRQSGTGFLWEGGSSLRGLRALCAAAVDFSSRHSLRTIKVVGADRTWYLYAGTELVSEFEDAATQTHDPAAARAASGQAVAGCAHAKAGAGLPHSKVAPISDSDHE